MTQFASKTPRDLNHDPEPWYNHDNGERWESRLEPHWESQPRPEFDHVPRPGANEPNPILVAVRIDTGATYATTTESVEAYLECICERRTIRDANNGYGVWSPAHIDHARRVLERLTRLAAL